MFGVLLFTNCKRKGCTDNTAINYDSEVDKDDGSCCVLSKIGNGVTDIDGNSYRTVILNGQEWMAENLAVTNFSNGDAIELSLDKQLSNRPPSDRVYCYKDNEIENQKIFGNM